jgi:nicotinate phosphoribosyltransferase
MDSATPWVTDPDAALLVDLYELTMVQAYWREAMTSEAVFSLYSRRLPAGRNFLLACGLDSVLRYLENLRFGEDSLAYLATLGLFSDDFLGWLAELRFEGDVWAVPEGTPVFPQEPLLEVVAPLPVAQLVETFVMNQIHFQTVLASKAARVVLAARGRTVVEFGLRRIHGTDAGMKAARAAYIAGVAATSNVLAGRVYGIPVTGTMAHSYIQAHDREMDAFRAITALYPETILLIDTYDTLEGARNVVRIAEELGPDFRVRGVRLDSGDLAELAVAVRQILDRAGLSNVGIFASGGLDEHSVDRLVAAGAPITGFGVGTRMGVASDAPSLDMAYKLVAYRGKGRLKLSRGKPILPGRKQLFRRVEGGIAVGDLIARQGESGPGEPLLRQVMQRGRRAADQESDLARVQDYARRQIALLPEGIRALAPAMDLYSVTVSQQLLEYQRQTALAVSGR